MWYWSQGILKSFILVLVPVILVLVVFDEHALIYLILDSVKFLPVFMILVSVFVISQFTFVNPESALLVLVPVILVFVCVISVILIAVFVISALVPVILLSSPWVFVPVFSNCNQGCDALALIYVRREERGRGIEVTETGHVRTRSRDLVLKMTFDLRLPHARRKKTLGKDVGAAAAA